MAGSGSGNALRGDKTNMGYENSSCTLPTPDPYGVALDLTAFTDAKLCAEITPDFTAEEVEFSTVSCGGTSGFGTDCAVENREYRVSVAYDMGFQNGFDRILAQFFGTSSAPVEQTPTEGDYLHVLSFSALSNMHFGTLAWETSQSDVIELPSCYVESINLSFGGAGEVPRYTAVMVANDAEFDAGAAENDNADLQSLALVQAERMVLRCSTAFRIKAMLDDGTDTALASPADVVPIVSAEVDMELPLEVIPEMTGGECNGPTESDKRAGTLTVEFKKHESNAVLSYQNWKAGTFYQADLTVTGSQIGAGEDLTFVVRFPKLCLIEAPSYEIVDPDINGYSLTFKILDSLTLIPGFTTQGPEAVFINQRPDIYLPV